MMTYVALLGAGALLAGLLCILLQQLGTTRSKDVFTLLLVYIAAIYVGPLIGSNEPAQYVEYAFAILLAGWCVVALRGSWVMLAAGYFAHGLWDALHPALLPHVLPPWYAPLCIGFDVTVALYLFARAQSAIER